MNINRSEYIQQRASSQTGTFTKRRMTNNSSSVTNDEDVFVSMTRMERIDGEPAEESDRSERETSLY